MADRWYNIRRRLAAYGYCTDSEPKAQTRSDGEQYIQRILNVHERSGGMLPLKKGTGAVWPRTGLLTKHHDIGALPYRGWYGVRTGMRRAS